MQLATVIGHATATVKHPTLTGWRLRAVQPLGAQSRPDGNPLLAVDNLGSRNGDRVIISNDGKGVQDMIGARNTPVRWAIVGLADEP